MVILIVGAMLSVRVPQVSERMMYRALVGMLDHHIQKFEVTRISSRTLTYQGHGGQFTTSRDGWYDTFDEAKGHLLDHKIRRIKGTERQLARLNNELEVLKGLEDGD